ncbi:putative phospholipase B-like lamina ancestor [Battus philenor]|uniref:putative phospholipase B-like lamina ancestor n=1 Tax=Battus philenor TaxID=42288 RepID=UPI0035CEE4F4
MSKMLKVVGASWLQTKISSYILGTLGILAILALFAGQIERIHEDGNYAATVFYSQKTGYRIEYWGQSNDLADLPKGVARAYFRMDIETTGWSLLEIETDGSYGDDIQAYAAGIVEGALTSYLIHTHLDNTIRAKCENRSTKKQCDRVRDELDKSVNIWKSYAAEREANDPFWHHVYLYYTQISGMYTGWKHGTERNTNKYDTDISDLYWLNSVADVVELQKKLNVTIDNSSVADLPGMSSAFLRIVNETLDNGTFEKKIYVAHNTAGSYSSMTRILKKYKLNYHKTSKDSSLAPGLSVEFSGYPGSITSQDEFYVIKGKNHRMAVTGTTLKNYNKKLWKSVNITEQIPVGPRVSAANKLASNVSTWGRTIAASNSGTASKQWLVVDFSQFQRLHSQEKVPKSDKKEVITEITINKDVKHTIIHRSGGGRGKGAVLLLEQVPGRTQSADLTVAVLESRYWATYGLPFFKDVAEITQVTKMEAVYGKLFSESESPRAITFKRGYKNATSLESIIQMMRMNNVTALYKGNESKVPDCSDDLNCILNEADSWSPPGVRGDILMQHQEAYGVIDTKVVSGIIDDDILELVAISSPPFTEPSKLNETETPINKGNVASIYTDQFDDEPTINGLQIRDLIKQKAEQESLEILNKDTLKPFQWSESSFKDTTHEGLADKWDFGLFRPAWSW